MGKKLYVGNLSYSVDSSELEQLFGQYGQVTSAQIISDRETGRSKGLRVRRDGQRRRGRVGHQRPQRPAARRSRPDRERGPTPRGSRGWRRRRESRRLRWGRRWVRRRRRGPQQWWWWIRRWGRRPRGVWRRWRSKRRGRVRRGRWRTRRVLISDSNVQRTTTLATPARVTSFSLTAGAAETPTCQDRAAPRSHPEHRAHPSAEQAVRRQDRQRQQCHGPYAQGTGDVRGRRRAVETGCRCRP